MNCRSFLFLIGSAAYAQTALPQNPIDGIVKLFDTYRIVMLGEIHESKQEHELLRQLIATPGFADRVNDIVVEFGNSRYQDIVDRYIAGENVPVSQVQQAWRNTMAIGPMSPLYGEFYAALRAVNKKLPKHRRLRLLLGDAPIDWEQVQSPEELGPFLPFRDQFFSSVVRFQVLAKKSKALLLMGDGHFRRYGGRPGAIESELISALVQPFVILPGSNMVNGYDDLDPGFDQLSAPALIEMKGSWIGKLQSTGGRGGPVTWDQTADAYLYLGPRDKLTLIKNSRSDLAGTPYGKEVERRLKIQFGQPPPFIPSPGVPAEQPAFSRNSPGSSAPLPAIPKPRP